MTETTATEIEEKELEDKESKLPISDFLKVVDSTTIFKNDNWWKAVALVEASGKRSVAMYLWHFKDGRWKRKHKFQVKRVEDWNILRESVEKFLPRLAARPSSENK